jgi:hypothetical protein
MGLRNGVRVAPVGLSPGTHAAGLLVVAIAVGMFSFSVLVIVHVQCRVILGDKYHHVLMLYWREIHQNTRSAHSHNNYQTTKFSLIHANLKVRLAHAM